MPRELTDVTDEVRNVPPPPVPEVPAPYGFRLADPDVDAAMISEWMNRPHLASTWRYDRPPAQWHRHLSIQLDGTFSRPLIGSVDGRDVAYLELFRAAKDYVATKYEAEPYDLGLHAAIADLTIINKGHSQLSLPHFALGVFNIEPQCHRIMFDVEHLNVMARRFCEHAGCAFLGEHKMPNRRIALYVLPRSPEHIPRLRDSEG